MAPVSGVLDSIRFIVKDGSAVQLWPPCVLMSPLRGGVLSMWVFSTVVLSW